MKFWIAGKAHPNTDGSYKKLTEFSQNDDFTKEEVDKFDMIGKPIHIFHNEKLIAGKIISQWKGYGGDYHIFGYLDLDTVAGRFGKNLIEKKLALDLSLSHEVKLFQNSLSGEITSKKQIPFEVSLVQEARMDTLSCKVYYSKLEGKYFFKF
jgi:hypothetical protein